jgi:hypothetical protein
MKAVRNALLGAVFALCSLPALATAPGVHLDFKKWQTQQSEGDLLYRLSMAPLPERQSARFALARFYLADNQSAEALGVLAAMRRADPKIEAVPDFRAMRGYAHYKLSHVAEASLDLNQLALDGDPQIWLYRAVLLQKTGKSAEAVAAYRKGTSALSSIPGSEQAHLKLTLAQAACTARQQAIATSLLASVEKLNLTKKQRAQIDLLKAKLAVLAGRADHADYYFAKLQNAPDRETAVEARLLLLQQKLATGQVTHAAAIKELDRLRFAWRGGALEFAVLKTLSDIYAADGQWRAAMTTQRQMVTYFPASDGTRQANAALQRQFADIFTTGKADGLPPLEALALFSDFRDFVPLGEQGDSMIRALSDRLVSLGLPERAAGLLDHQVRYRLTGTPQAIVAIRAALVNLQANQPKAALAILRLTKQNDMPADVLQAHSMVEARTLVQLGQTESALDLMDGNTSRLADYVRLDAYWRAKDWQALRAEASRLYATDRKLQLADQKQLMRLAFSLNMAGSAADRDILRRRFGATMAGTRYKDAFQLMTSAQELSTEDTRKLASSLADIDQLQDLSSLYAGLAAQARQSVVKPRLKFASN